ncbi:MFS transporter [Paraburkholderia youngii]|uniref:MFS transporter n=1 Tax=Paraburkholderia youngii TaxID=2782701 RepID=UPI003D235703
METSIGELVGSPTKASTFAKVSRRVIPFLFVCYVFAFLDRVNIGIAQIDMKRDVGFTDLTYSIGAGIFFVGYLLMEVPSNLILDRYGAKKAFSRIMILWGALAATMAFVRTPTEFSVVRFFLGAAEAGFFPGLVFYLTRWYPLERRAKVMSIFVCGVGVAGVIGGPLSGWIMANFDGLHGLYGWQWMFIVEGLPSCVLGVIAYFYLDESPAQAKWLSASERAIVAAAVARSSAVSPDKVEHTLRTILLDPKVYIMGFVWFTQVAGVYATAFWLPTLIKEAGVQGRFTIGIYSAIPYFVSWITLIALGHRSDRMMERRWHCAVTMAVGACGLLVAGIAHGNPALTIGALSVAAAGAIAPNPLFWAIATDYIRGKGAAGGIAFVNCMGVLGAIVSPLIIGSVKTLTNSVLGGMGIMASLMILGAVTAVTFVPATTLRSPQLSDGDF